MGASPFDTDIPPAAGGTARIRVRPAEPAHAEPISQLIGSLAGYFLADPDRPQDAAAFFESTTPQAIAGRLADPRYQYHVALAAGRLVGCAAIRDASHLYQLFVERGHQGAGLGRRLWEISYQAAGCPLSLTVNASLFAVPFYQHLGFAVTGSVVHKDGVAYQPMKLAPEARADG